MSMRSSPRKFFLIIAAGLAALTALALWKLGGRFLPIYPLWLICASVVTFIFYGFDKMQSRWDGWRVPEAVLHTLSLAGGFIGGFCGRRFFRHKTQKPLFLLIIIASAILHAALAVWFFVL